MVRSESDDGAKSDRSLDEVDELLDRSTLHRLTSGEEDGGDLTRAESRRVARSAIEWFVE